MERIDAETHIDQILSEYPSLSRLFIEFGLPCLVCGEPFWGTVEQLGNQHNINIGKLVEKLNEEKAKFDEKT
jgi:hypothetical protein